MFQAKKKGMSPNEKTAKMSVVEEMRKMAQSMMGDKLKGMQKVSVAAPDHKTLALGLDKAKQIVGDGEEAGEDPKEEASESPHMEMAEEAQEPDDDQNEFAHLSPEEIDQKLQELMALKAKLKA